MPSVAKTRVLPSATGFTWSAPPLVFGRGAFDELGHHAAALGLRRVALVTDPGLARTDLPERAARLLGAAGIASVVYADVHIEPTDESLRAAVRSFAQKEIAPIAAEFDESGEFPLDTVRKMGAMMAAPFLLEGKLSDPKAAKAAGLID